MVVQFLRDFSKALGFDVNTDIPTLSVLQEGLLNLGDSMQKVEDLLVRLLSAAVCDPGLIIGYKVRKENTKIIFICTLSALIAGFSILAEECIH